MSVSTRQEIKAVSVIESSRRRAEGWAPDDQQLEIRCVTSECNLNLDLLWIELKLTKLKHHILLYIRYTSYFGGPSNLGALCGCTARTGFGTPLPVVSVWCNKLES